jgi:hypothetical protein
MGEEDKRRWSEVRRRDRGRGDEEGSEEAGRDRGREGQGRGFHHRQQPPQ